MLVQVLQAGQDTTEPQRHETGTQASLEPEAWVPPGFSVSKLLFLQVYFILLN